MAGKMQLAAKILLGSTVLASGGGGVYYATTHDWTGLHQNAKRPAASDLDALASAWAEPAASQPSDHALSTPTARSAATPARAVEPVVKPPSDDRYAHAGESPTPAAVVKDEAAKVDPTPTKQKTQKSGKTNDRKDVKLASHTEAKNAEDAPSPTPVLASSETEIARGQEPRDEPLPSTQVKDLSANAGSINPTPKNGNQVKEPKPLTAPGQQSNIADASRRAKQAFGDSSPQAAGNRYGDVSPPASEAAGPPKTVAVNPFAAKPIADSSAQARNQLLEPLPSTSNDVGGRLSDLQQGSGQGLRPLETSPTARAATRDPSAKARTAPGLPPRNTANTDFGPLPSSQNGYLPDTANSAGPTPKAGDGSGKPGEKALEGPQQPTLVIQKFAPGEIQVGKPAKFVLQLRNAGSQAADNVTVQDEIPQGTQLISTTPNATTEGSRLVWQLGKLSAGEDRTVEMQVMPKAEGDIGSVATVSYSAQASVKTHCTMPQLAIRMTAPSEVMIGNQQHVKIEIRNPGSGDATGVMLFENVPPNVKHVSGPALEFEIGTLRAARRASSTWCSRRKRPEKWSTRSPPAPRGTCRCSSKSSSKSLRPPSRLPSKDRKSAYLERPATYEVSVENPGTAPAHDVQIVTKLPKGMRFVRANNMGEYDAASHAVYWSLAELPKGEKGTVELVTMPIEAGPQTLQVESHAQQGLADKTQRDILIEGLAAIKFDVHTLQDPIEVGGETGYEIRVVNQGTKAATNVQITAELPAGLKLISAEGETQHKMDQGRLVFEPIQQLAPKADTVYRIRAQGLQPGDQRVVVEVKTDDLQQPIHREESTRVFGDQ